MMKRALSLILKRKSLLQWKISRMLYSDYLRSLRTLVGLGFTAALVVDRGMLLIYRRYFEEFMEQKAGDFKAHRNAKTLIAQSAAEMVGTAAICFSILKCPQYYQDFFAALYTTIAKIAQHTSHNEHVEHILGNLSIK